ncbi:anti-sigma factor [Nocardioides panacis]|uniref:Anti-sigma factor n=1 Tax=Nocardioides panacis TaxID=2849501 RepID=A0A975Y2I3_9ACTN|nr:anti-sigma factor [Nocardioides panacis]QWZ10580.1 anti-sigma factor [Nocardioides panacis]
MSTDLHTLSGAYAVDALSAEEAQAFDTHLEECQACRDEVRELQEAAAMMGASEARAAPPALKARVLAAADQLPQLPPKVTSLDAAPSRRWTARVLSAAAAVVLVVAAGFAVSQNRPDQPSITASTATVFAAQDAHTKTVKTDRGSLTVATSPSLGRMAVQTDGLQKLPTSRAYQMWTIHAGTATSAGLIENLKAGKVMSMPSAGTTVAITVEPAGGSTEPTSKPIVTVDPEQV